MKNPIRVTGRRQAWRCAPALALAVLLPAPAPAGTASVTAGCRSLILDEFAGVDSGSTVWISVTTFDGLSGRPLGLNADDTFDNSAELRPRLGNPGVYEADYAAYESGLVAYGHFVLNLPTTDSDANGLPDVGQKDKASNLSFTGDGYADYAVIPGNQGPFLIQNGHLTRAANAPSGSFSYTSVEASRTINYSGTFRLSTASGTAEYTRGASTSVTFNLTLEDGMRTTNATGSTSFTVVNANQITIPQFTLTLEGSLALTVLPMTLNRTGQKYIGDMILTDGDFQTPWPDYTRWVVEILDPNDANGDGIPDLSDPVVAPNAPPSVRLAAPLNGSTFPTPAMITLSAEASAADGAVTNVEFFSGTTRLRQTATAPWTCVWTNPPLGAYTLTAKATDNLGASAASSPVRIIVNEDRARRVLYSTAFEPSEGYKKALALTGQNGWMHSGAGLNGLQDGALAGQGTSAFLGVDATNSWDLYLWQPLNYTPEPTLPLIKFSVTMQIRDSTNYNYDQFVWEMYNSLGSPLFSLLFDNYDWGIYYSLEGDSDFVDTGKTFTNTNVHQLLISLDIPANRWNASLDGVPLVSQLPITTSNSLVDIGDFDAAWWIYYTDAPGDNCMIFDNYTVSAEAKGGVAPGISVIGRRLNGQITLRVQGSPALSYTLQASSNLVSWADRQTKSADSSGIVDFTEPFTASATPGFYRARQNP